MQQLVAGESGGGHLLTQLGFGMDAGEGGVERQATVGGEVHCVHDQIVALCHVAVAGVGEGDGALCRFDHGGVDIAGPGAEVALGGVVGIDRELVDVPQVAVGAHVVGNLHRCVAAVEGHIHAVEVEVVELCVLGILVVGAGGGIGRGAHGHCAAFGQVEHGGVHNHRLATAADDISHVAAVVDEGDVVVSDGRVGDVGHIVGLHGVVGVSGEGQGVDGGTVVLFRDKHRVAAVDGNALAIKENLAQRLGSDEGEGGVVERVVGGHIDGHGLAGRHGVGHHAVLNQVFADEHVASVGILDGDGVGVGVDGSVAPWFEDAFDGVRAVGIDLQRVEHDTVNTIRGIVHDTEETVASVDGDAHAVEVDSGQLGAVVGSKVFLAEANV